MQTTPPKWEGAWAVKERALWPEQLEGNEQRGDDGGAQGILERRVDFSKVTQQDQLWTLIFLSHSSTLYQAWSSKILNRKGKEGGRGGS